MSGPRYNSNNKYVTQAKENSPFTHGTSPQQNAQGTNKARAQRQQEINKQYRGGRVPENYGVSPDSPATGYSPYPTFRTAGLSTQNSNSASKNGNNNLAVGNENQKYDICATNPSASVCAGTEITQSLPKPKGGSKSKRKSKRNSKKHKKVKKTRKLRKRVKKTYKKKRKSKK
jgi:hypothetical protein